MHPRPAPRPVDLGTLIHGVDGARVIGDPSVTITSLELDSRQVRAGDCFAALPGHVTHGMAFIDQALTNGAAAVLTDDAGVAMIEHPFDRPIVLVPDPRRILGMLSRCVYGDAASGLCLLGVTGTNGKTTVTYMLEAGLRAAGRTTGVIGTVGIRIADQVLPGARTTPESVHLHALLGVMREAGIDSVAMEVSSHALSEGRVDGLRFAVAGFTNLTQDHLDYHGTMEAYFAAKASLFTAERAERAVIGIDDDWGRRLAEHTRIPTTTWALDHEADWSLEAVDGRWFAVGPDERQQLDIPLPGAFNRANALCAFVMLRQVGVPAAQAAAGIATVAVPGRMEIVGTAGGVTGIVDYAHTPDAVERAIASAREIADGRILVVIGAGGDRDRSKRPLMGASAARLADLVIVTDDNPRSEDPALIRAAVLEGAMTVSTDARSVADRRNAVVEAVALAHSGDVVLVLGKGHEQGQDVGGTVLPFDDREVLRAVLAGAP